jgi:hypothetical protein
VDWSAKLNSVLYPAASESEHFRAVCLHVKVAERPRIRILWDMVDPAKNRDLRFVHHGVVNRVIGPLPELVINLVMELEEVTAMRMCWPMRYARD